MPDKTWREKLARWREYYSGRDAYGWPDTQHCIKWYWIHLWNGLFVCPKKGHDWYFDMCGREDHQLCERCEERFDSQMPITPMYVVKQIWEALCYTFDKDHFLP
jgi:hypothetical protein